MNPKDVMGGKKVPLLSVLPPASLIHEALAMRYGAYLAPKADGTFGYGAFNWRTSPISAAKYYDAALRHLLAAWDGEDFAQDSKLLHLAHAKATLGIVLDARENGVLIDDRPPKGSAAHLLELWRLI